MDYDLAINTIKAVLKDVRPKLLQAFGNVDSTDKADGSSVTELDVFVEQTLKSSLGQIDSTIGFFGEETEHESLSEKSWIIDPIDGTDYFIRGIPLCANLIALYENGEVTLGVVYNFITDEFFYAVRGRGAFVNGQPIKVKDRSIEKALAQLASGKYDGIICRQPYENIWDVAAGTLLVNEAGGRVVNLGEEGYDVKNLDLFAGSNVLYDELKLKGLV